MVISSFNVFGQLHCARDYLAFFCAFLRGHYFLSQWTTGSAGNLGKGIKKAKTQLASGPLFKVDHWLGQKPGKRSQVQNPV